MKEQNQQESRSKKKIPLQHEESPSGTNQGIADEWCFLRVLSKQQGNIGITLKKE
jgi:hypothetical protein